MKKNLSWVNPKLEVRMIENLGNGLYAKENISKNTLLSILGGFVMTLEQEKELDEEIRDYSCQIAPNFVIGANNVSDICSADFFNHSCDPNIGFHGQIFLISMRNIKKDEQICFDYAMVLTITDYEIPCLCGSDNCRGKITGHDWQDLELQKKYKGYFQTYLEDKINGNEIKYS